VASLTAAPATFDAVLALNILQFIDSRAARINKASTLLKPDEIFVSSTIYLGDLLINLWRLARAPMLSSVDPRLVPSKQDSSGALSQTQ
jgi:2-polyprenyl-3-methyl-5-hydroxy-6-metoxy-1,4-benzoquinol methylase